MMDSETNNNEEGQMEALETSAGGSVKDEGFWRMFWHQIRLVWYLLRDPEVPLYVKVIPLAALIYALIPTDFIPDVFPIIGQLDDITALLVGGKVFIELSPPHVVQRYLYELRGRTDALTENGPADDSPSLDLDDAIIIEGDFESISNNDEDRAE
jgi:uncharacterized membrane protein YkvA (DUF1232 family)